MSELSKGTQWSTGHFPFVCLSVDIQARFVEVLAPERQERRLKVFETLLPETKEWCAKYFRNLSPHRLKEYTEGNDQFRNSLRACGVPTVHVGYKSYDSKSYAPILMKPDFPWLSHPELRDEAQLLRELERVDVPTSYKFLNPIYRDESIIIKNHHNVFSSKKFENDSNLGPATLLEGYGTNTLIVTGGHTSLCVAETVKGALESGFNVWVIYDQLTDGYEVGVRFGKDFNDRIDMPQEDGTPEWHKEQIDTICGKWMLANREVTSALETITAEECLIRLRRFHCQTSPCQ